jgi:predicted DNA-binding transcriptional regulator YafY
MATNKNASIRYQALDRCFRNPGRRYYMEDLVNACNDAISEFSGRDEGVKKRQIFEDIKYMESAQGWNIPLEHIKDGRKVYFRYEDMSFSINQQPLNEMEAEQLREAVVSLSRFKGMPQFEWVEEIAARLDILVGWGNEKKQIIEFDQNQYLKGLEFITTIYNAILYGRTILIQYQSFKQEEVQELIYSPYYLKQYNNRWFVFGRRDGNDYIINLSLDRIIMIEERSAPYIKNEDIDFSEYFEDIVGVSVPNDGLIHQVIIKVSDALLPYIKTKPIHGSQKIVIKEQNESLVFLTLMPNYELESLLLSYGEGIEVLSPESLRQKMSQRIVNMQEKYKID